jgi:Protein of unknown function (DUF2911)
MRACFGSIAAVLAFAVAAVAQQEPAPRDTASLEIDGKNVAVEYGQPSLHGRSFDELMKQLPEDRMWRTGTDQVTTLTSAADLEIGGTKVPAGKYTLYVHCPVEGPYSLAINSDLGQPLGKIFAQAPPNLANEPWPHFEYKKEIADKEVARVPMKKLAVDAPADRFTVTLTPAEHGAVMTMTWGDRRWSVDLKSAR